jgi:hypothetical protein
MTVTRDRQRKSIAFDQIGYIKRIVDRFKMTDSRKCKTPMEIRYKPHAIQANEEPFKSGMYRKAIGSILYAALGTRPDITYAVTALGRYVVQPSKLHWEAIKHLLRYLRGTDEYKLIIYDSARSRLGRDHDLITCFADANLGGEVDSSTSTSGILIFVHGILVIRKSKKQTIVAQSTMEAEMIAMAYGKEQIHWLQDLTSEMGHGIGTRKILNDGPNYDTTLNSGNFQSDSRHLRFRDDSIHRAIVKSQIEVLHLPGTAMLAYALTKALGGVKLREFVQEVGLHEVENSGMDSE